MSFQIGDVVEVRKHGRATVIETEGHMQGRLRVRYHVDSSTYWVTQDRLRKMILATRRVVVAYHTAEYRQAAVHNTDVNDVCLEIGCHAGVTTHMLSKRCKWVVGVDLSPHVVQVAREKYPDVQFEQLDGSDVAGANALALAAGHTSGYNKVFIDVSGQAPLSVLLPILTSWLSAAPQSTIIVKNRALHVAVAAAEKHRQQVSGHQSSSTNTPLTHPSACVQQSPLLHQPPSTNPQQASSVQGSTTQPTENATSSQPRQHLLTDEVYSLLLGSDKDRVDPQHLAMLHTVCEQAEAYAVCFGSSAPITLDDSRTERAAAVLQSNPALAASLVEDLTGSVTAIGDSKAGAVVQVEVPAVLSSGVAAVLQAAKVASDTAEKEARKQAKAERRRLRKQEQQQVP